MSKQKQTSRRQRERRWFQFGLSSLLLVMVLAALASYWFAREEELEEFEGSGAFRIVRQVLRDDDGKPLSHGQWSLYDDDGRLLARGVYDQGEPDGIWSYWHANGQLRQQGEFRDGQRQGVWRQWHANGKREAEVTYVEGAADGPAQAWWPDGSPRYRGQQVDGVRSGRWTLWDEGGRRSEGVIQRGRKQGVWLAWDAEGNALPPQTFSRGRPLVDDHEALRTWRERLYDPHPWQRGEAAFALVQFRARAVPTLCDALRSGDEDVQLRAMQALGRLGAGARGAVDPLIAALADEREAFRLIAVTTLGRIGPAAKGAVPPLEALLPGADETLRGHALAAIASIDPSRQRIVEQLIAEYAQVDPGGLVVLDPNKHWFPPIADGALPGIERALESPDAGTRAGAAVVLGRLEPASPRAVRLLIGAMDDESPQVRRYACLGLGLIGRKAGRAAPKLQELVQTAQHPDVAKSAEYALQQITDWWPPTGQAPGGFFSVPGTLRRGAPQAQGTQEPRG